MVKGKENIVCIVRFKALLCCLLMGLSGLKAQYRNELQWGPLWEKTQPSELLDMFGIDSSHFSTITFHGRKNASLVITTFETESLTPVVSAQLSLPTVNDLAPYYIEALSFAGSIYMIASVDDPQSEKVSIYAFRYNASLECEGAPKLLGSMPRNVVLNNGVARLQRSTEGDFLVVLTSQEEIPQRNEKFKIGLFDAALQMVHEKELQLPYPMTEVRFGDLVVDEDQAVYLLISKDSERLKEVNKVQNAGRDHYLLSYSWADNVMAEKALSIGVKWIYDAHMLINTQGHLQVAGYFSNMVDVTMAGTFSVSFDRNNGAIVDQGLSPFDRAFKTQFRPVGNLQERPDLALFETDLLLAKHNNEVMLLSEKRDLQSRTMFNPVTGSYYIVENYLLEELLVTSISPSSKVRFNFKIPKFQVTVRNVADYSSFLAWSHDDDTFLVFNDHEKNFSLGLHSGSKYSALSSPVNAQAVMYHIAPDGGLHKHALFNTSPKGCTLNPAFHYPMHDGVILYTIGSNGFQFARVKLIKANTAIESE
jgi:hypothetical protein